jgi:glutaredoxin-like YruB-family protein
MSKIIVYSTKMCPYCTMLKDFLKEKKVEFEAVDVGEDREKAEEMIKKSGQMGVPQIEINGKIIVGFNKLAIEEELSKM